MDILYQHAADSLRDEFSKLEKENADLTRQLSEARDSHKIALTEFYDLASLYSPLVVEHERTLRQLAEAREEIEHLKSEIQLIIAPPEAVGKVVYVLTEENKKQKAEIARLNKMRVHCENCGADYMATGIEAGCPCKLTAEIARLRDRLFKRGEMFSPPCFSCGYNGEGYFNPKFHPCAEKHHKLAKALEASDGSFMPDTVHSTMGDNDCPW